MQSYIYRTKRWFNDQPLVISARRKLALHQLESRLEKIFRVSNSHQLRKIKRGSPEYVSLWHAANGAVMAFCQEHNVNRVEIENQVPSLMNLADLATQEVSMPRWAQATGLTLAIVIVAILVGIIGGLSNLGFHAVTHFIR